MEHLSDKIDDLSEMMRRLTHERPSNGGLSSSRLALPLHSSLQSGSNTNGRSRPKPLDESRGIESTLFSHVIFATKFLQSTVSTDPSSNVTAEMTLVLDALRSTVNIQKQQNDAIEGTPPFSKAIPPGFDLRDLPIPSMDRILACLRVAHGSYS